jgi:hypothetical protein
MIKLADQFLCDVQDAVTEKLARKKRTKKYRIPEVAIHGAMMASAPIASSMFSDVVDGVKAKIYDLVDSSAGRLYRSAMGHI